MREDPFVVSISQFQAVDLINEFNERANTPIDNTADMSLMYAIYIALTFKDQTEVAEFFTKGKNLKFEWFSDIANFYFANYKPAPVFDSQIITTSVSEEQPKSLILTY